jgi:hypothetical protein
MTYDVNKGPWWLVQYLDPDGVSRAWSAGDPTDKQSVRDSAARELVLYRAKKVAKNDTYLATAQYARHQEFFEPTPEGGRNE